MPRSHTLVKGDRRFSLGPTLPWAFLGIAVLGLHAAGAALPSPPLGSPSAWAAWAAGRDPVVVSFAVVRLLALGAAWYCLAVGAAGVGLRLVDAGAPALVVDRITVAPLRRLVAASVVAWIAAGPLGAAVADSGPVPAPRSGPAPAPAAVTMHRLEPGEVATPSTEPPPSLPPPASWGAESGAAAPADARAGRGATWTVQPGQCFWSIAEAALSRAWGRPPAVGEIEPYWQRLIEANRSVLADPHNADLVFPGQVFALPAP